VRKSTSISLTDVAVIFLHTFFLDMDMYYNMDTIILQREFQLIIDVAVVVLKLFDGSTYMII
jgi:hypothetical protein